MEKSSLPSLEEVLRHRPPMVLLNRIIEHSHSATCCEVVIGPRSMFVQSGGGVPTWVGFEYMAQTMAAHVGMEALARGKPVPLGFLLGTRRLKLHAETFVEGQELRVSAESVWDGAELASFACEVRDARTGSVLVEGHLNAYRADDMAAVSGDLPS